VHVDRARGDPGRLGFQRRCVEADPQPFAHAPTVAHAGTPQSSATSSRPRRGTGFPALIALTG
jgi:hypothetical protein